MQNFYTIQSQDVAVGQKNNLQLFGNAASFAMTTHENE
jgi:hypothetical protein